MGVLGMSRADVEKVVDEALAQHDVNKAVEMLAKQYFPNRQLDKATIRAHSSRADSAQIIIDLQRA